MEPRHVADPIVRQCINALNLTLPDADSSGSSDADTYTDGRSSSDDDMSQDELYTATPTEVYHFETPHPKKTAKRKLPRSPGGSISTANKFAALQNESSGAQPVPAATATTSTAETQKKRRMPPIFLKNKEKWTAVSSHFAARNISFTKASNTGQGIKIEPTTPDDYRKIVNHFDAIKAEYFSYALPEDKPISAVLRGVPTEFTEEEITKDLIAKGFESPKALRMKKGPGRVPMPLVMVRIARSEKAKEIYNITEIIRVDVTVETPKARNDVTQCYRCQGFGHTQHQCKIKPRCVKCAGEHFATECPKTTRDTPAKCANCQGAHPANYRGCAQFPKPRPRQTQTVANPPPTVATAPRAWPSLPKGAPPVQRTEARPERRASAERPVNHWQKPATERPPRHQSERASRQQPERTDRRRNSKNAAPPKQNSGFSTASNDYFTPENISGLLRLVFRIGASMNKARSRQEAIEIIISFSEEICQICRSYD